MRMILVPWDMFERRDEAIEESEGGGYRSYYPSLGYAVYGVGTNWNEVMASLKESQESYEEAVMKWGLPLPNPENGEFLARSLVVLHERFPDAELKVSPVRDPCTGILDFLVEVSTSLEWKEAREKLHTFLRECVHPFKRSHNVSFVVAPRNNP